MRVLWRQFDLTDTRGAAQLSVGLFLWFSPLLTGGGDCWMRLTGWRTKPLLQRRQYDLHITAVAPDFAWSTRHPSIS